MLQSTIATELSPRERDIVKARALGLSYKEIGSRLDISINTVKTHLVRIFLKLDVRCSLEMIQAMRPADCSQCEFCRVPARAARPRKLRLARAA